LAGRRVRAVIESMNGARFVHDTLEERGWEVLIADAQTSTWMRRGRSRRQRRYANPRMTSAPTRPTVGRGGLRGRWIMKTVLLVAVLAVLAVPVLLVIGIALGPTLLVLLLIGACAVPFLLVVGAMSHHPGRH
jgi:hypothetical protein